MERDDGVIHTPSTSRSNSINEDETNLSTPVVSINPSEFSSPEDVTEQIKTIPETQLTVTSNSSSDFDTDFVAINTSDLDQDANNASYSIEPSYNAIVTDVNTEKSYQPIFGSFSFADSDPLSRAAFVTSSSLSSEVETIQERQMDNCTVANENNTSNSDQVTPSLPPSLESTENIDDNNDEEDDFDGIPIRHASITMKEKLNGDSDSMMNHSNHDHLFDAFINHIENSQDDYDLEDDSFLNDFTDEQHDTTAIVPSLFKDIPDIDDPNEHEEDNDDRILFDHMDMYNQSDSIRSSSPDSLLSSSHLQDEQDDDDDDDVNFDDEVTQWNDDNILHSSSSNINSQTNRTNLPLILHMHPFDQVDFIDSSRSNSRCSNVSSHLSFGYADQARIFISDDGLMTSSDSDDNDNNDDDMNLDSDTFNHNNEELCLQVNDDDNEDVCLQVNLDDNRSVSSSSRSNSTCSILSASNEVPIIDIDDDNDESKNLQIAPIAAMDDEDENENDLQIFQSNQSILPTITSNIKNLLELKNEQRKNEIVHEIINMRHLLNENNHDDEFIAIMHNPRIFEEVLYDHDNSNNNNNNDEKKLDLVKQINSVTCNFRSSSQLSIDNKIKNESFEHHQNIQQTSPLLESNNEKTPHSYTTTTTTTTTIANNSSSSTAADYLILDGNERKKNAPSADVVYTTDILNIKQQKEQLQCEQTNTSHIDSKQFTNVEEHNRVMSTDNESDDDDLELLKTLSQLHGIINTTPSIEESNRIEHQISSDSSSINQEQNSPEYLHENIITNGNQAELLNKRSRQNTPITLQSSPYVTDTIKNSDEEQEEKDEKKNIIFYKNHYNDDDDDGSDERQKEKYANREEKKTTTFFSLTSTSPALFNNDSHSTVVAVDPDASSLLPNLLLLSSNKLTDSSSISNQLIADVLQISNTKSNMDNLSDDKRNQEITTTDLFDPFSPTATTTTGESNFDNIFTQLKDDNDVEELNMQSTRFPSNSTSTQPLGNYSFDDLWNQSISQIESLNESEIKPNNDFDPNTFSWDAFLNNDNNKNEKLNPFDDNTIIPNNVNITWESLFGEEQEAQDKNDLKNFLDWIIDHLDDSEQIDVQPIITFTSTQNLESIVKDIQMCSMPFEPIPSPPLHIDHTVSNPMINGIHHELFPINELEQVDINQGQQSMIIYEEDENEIEKENDEISSINYNINLIAENLVSNIIELALNQVDEPYYQVEHFVDQILSEAVFEIYNEDYNLLKLEKNDTIPIENLATIINWHNSIKTTNNKLLDPFDSTWINQFQTSNNTTNENLVENENKTNVDPWLLTSIEHKNELDPMTLSNTLDESDLFSSISNPVNKISELEDDETGTLSEYLPPPILRDPSNATTAANNLMKYTLTAPVLDDSGDDSSFQEDYFMSHKNESSIVTNTKVDEEPIKTKDLTSTDENEIETDEQNNIFSQRTHSLEFEAFASDQPLDSSEIESKFPNITAQFNDEFDESSQQQQQQPSTDDNTPWITIEKTPETIQTSSINKDEPWELEDSGEENITPEKSNLHKNYFSDSFNVPTAIEKHPNDDKDNYDDYFTKQQLNENIEQSLTKNAYDDDNKENMQTTTSLKDNINATESSTTSDSDIVEVNDIAPNVETINDRITDHMQTSYVNVDEADVKIEHPNEPIETTPRMIAVQSESEDLPPPLPALPPLNNKSNISNKNLPLKSALLSSNNDTQYKKDLLKQIHNQFIHLNQVL
ncbi:unnamed protein product [Rotaria sordida]|uniref:Uncharacterized protein n=1 Tax=Rotaria sordida TaxID=392033 RepID=A0A814GPS4_9BILA|nr:unnamed protein product [Rotaria sordida]